MMQINFKAKYITSMPVKKHTNDGNYKDVSLSLVNVDTKNENDLKALYDITQSQKTIFLYDVYDDALSDFKKKTEKSVNILLLTEQQKDFDKLEADKICGYTDFSRKSKELLRVNYLETLRNNRFEIENREYKGIGKAFLDFFKQYYSRKIKHISLHIASENVREFYTKNGFEQCKQIKNELIWTKPPTLLDKFFALLRHLR